ncbi:MAG: MotA/TolQ/ExbB proton channel family protein [Pirellulales bacterium]|nr:MotA/TolQ/ExbB proton channel family protein [Pirellulales bacterium]
MKDKNSSFASFSKSPILWGGLASTAFYLLLGIVVRVQQELGEGPASKAIGAVTSLLREYMAGHPIEYATTVLFFIGLATLVIKAVDLARQPWPRSQSGLLLGPVVRGGQPFDTIDVLLSRLDGLKGRHSPLLVNRLRGVLERIDRRGSAERLEDELMITADRDADRLHESYALFRVVIWAIPILGFLGTVIGIIMAIAQLSPTAIEESMPTTIAALSVAFATTAQSLSLSILLMFGKYRVGQVENRLLAAVDQRADEELLGRFEQVASGAEGQLTAIRRMSETMIDAAEHLVARQTELWQNSIDAAQQRWTRLTSEAEAQLGKAMGRALGESLEAHAAAMVAAESQAAERNQKHWQQFQETLARSTEAAAALQESVNTQTDVLRRTVEATGQVAKLEETLHRNLAALAGAKHFEQTVMSLAAAIHLLNARLEELPGEPIDVELEPKRSAGQAA